MKGAPKSLYDPGRGRRGRGRPGSCAISYSYYIMEVVCLVLSTYSYYHLQL